MNHSGKKIMPKRRGFRKTNQGTSLIEVLIAVLILGIGLLGIAAMQAVTLRNGQSSLERTQAVMHGYAILDSMRGNLENTRIDAYDIPRTCTIPTTNASLAQRDLVQWLTNMQNTLGPNACGTIVCTPTIGGATINTVTSCDVTVDWIDSRGTNGSTVPPVVTPVSLIMRSRI
jgi:type IV pilus assembly protein PilV